MYTTYQELEDAVVEWTDREDIRPRVVDFIRLVTRYASRQLRVPTMERTTTATVFADGSIQIPLDLVELISLDWITIIEEDDGQGGTQSVVTARKVLDRGTIQEYKDTHSRDIESDSYKAEPIKFAREGNLYKVYPLPRNYTEIVDDNGFTGTFDIVGTAEIHYFALPATLSGSSSSNWLLELAPEVYLYGALSHAYEYVRDLETAAFWNARMENALAEIQAWSIRADDAGGNHAVPLGD